jgi:hypothetical protein
MEKEMSPIKKTARLASLFWILGAITTIFSLFYIQSRLVVSGDAAATANNILANQSLFRVGIVSDLLERMLTFFFGLTIFHLFRGVSKKWTTVFLSSILIVVAIGVANSLNNVASLAVLSKAAYLNVFSQEQLNALAMLFLRLNGSGQVILEIFWLPYLFSFGLLIVKSKFIPRIFGISMMIGSFGFPLTTFAKFLIPQSGFPEIILLVTQIFVAPALITTNFWFLIKGVNGQQQISEV